MACQLFSWGFHLFAQVPSELHPQQIILRADSQQKTGGRYELVGNVEITYRDMQLTADRVDYDETTGELTAGGHIVFSRPAENQEMQAGRAEYNLWTGTGSFFDVQGSFGAQIRGGSSLLTTTAPFFFTAERVDRVGENTYRVQNGKITVCSLPNPTWTFVAPTAIVRPGESLRIYNSQFHLLNVPIFYSPFVYRSLRRIPRSSGFLMPTVGTSSRLGLRIGDSFFWAIHRSMDAEIGVEYLSKRGWMEQGTFRMKPKADSYLNVSYFGVQDRGFGPQRVDQGGHSVRAEGVVPLDRGVRGVLDFNYLSSLTFREAFTQSYAEAVNSEVHSTGFLSKSFDSFQLNLLFLRLENFQSIRPNDTVIIRYLPHVELNSVERPWWSGAPLWLSWDSSVGAVSRSEPLRSGNATRLRTTNLERYEFYPRISLPLQWKEFRLTPTVGYRSTRYGARRDEGQISGEALFRGTRELAVELALPPLSKVFSGAGALYARPFQHVVEPKVTFRSVSGADRFADVLLFDARDLITNTRELEYSLTNRLLIKQEGAQGLRESLSWELRQQYYFDPSFGNALAPSQRNVFASNLVLTSDAFLDRSRRFSPVVSIFRFRPSGHYDVEFREDYDTTRHRVTNGGLIGNARWGETFLSVSHFFVRSSPALSSPSNQIGFTAGYGNLARRGFNAAFAGNYDFRAGFLQFSAFQVSYNNECCGISFEYRRFALGPVRNENQFRVAFSLANIGTFGNMKRQERLF
ncbi:MAG: LPS-assembly protein LptD [Acidobacteria bacterium]|nr:LPS-assembly protein LptD [Acidobacteriota bacterium]